MCQFCFADEQGAPGVSDLLDEHAYQRDSRLERVNEILHAADVRHLNYEGVRLLRRLQGALCQPSQAVSAVSCDSLVERAKEYIWEHHTRAACGLRAVATGITASPRQLSRRFKATTGTTVVKYLHETRIAHAKRLLGNPQLSAKEIAALVGYNRTSRLGFHFKRLNGTTPSGFRSTAKGTT
ncbi:MAG: AraC family transcriptional regulator [Acidobacteriota bacterium]|nr:AraC family transcriptional regulator [Acidobacteriota bacterium]